jgi:hypothetical protein
MSDAKSKNILKIKKSKKEVECTEEAFDALLDIIIDFSLFAFLSSNALSTLMSDFVANENVVARQSTSLDS